MVEARRVEIAGMMIEAAPGPTPTATLTCPSVVIWLTSGATLRLIRSPTMVGVNASETPTCLYVTAIVLPPALA